MKLETDRLIIVPCTKQTMTSDYPCGPHIIQHLHALKEDPALLYWGVWLVKRKADDKIIGDMGFKGRPDENKTAEVGYGFLESCWNKGYATEALAALLKWAKHTYEVDKVIAETHLDNPASMRVLEKVNMQKEKQTESMLYWKLDLEDIH
ncbi:N-acetyltransferase [Oceanobacillus oncorhynchi subsp. incaldanensis]|uniref:GNAT family N-acetyltransferase n=1 Tax=Oceanobacillus TaxID=182709 RepID=UPI001B1CB80C|nr:GNAT family N-acetyltransferase [Oceanobacillus oncorhynchi]GIO18089.1 N-acetyltransferase [Oceanobacillus oncorhynchi subsp. incaldanensis]